jgi:hypothetical protein
MPYKDGTMARHNGFMYPPVRRKRVLHKIENAIEWVSVPAMLVGSVFTYFAASYEPMLDFALCLCGLSLAGRALYLREYFLAAGFIAILVAASPLLLVSKIFLLLGLACVGAGAKVFAAFRTQPMPAAWTQAMEKL